MPQQPEVAGVGERTGQQGREEQAGLQQSNSNHFTHWELNGKHVRSLLCSLEQQKIPEWVKQELSR